MYPATIVCLAGIYHQRLPDRPILLGQCCLSPPPVPALTTLQVVLLLVLEILVSSLIVTAILKGSNTGFRKTDKLMKKIAV
jgi:hypothetical protein